MNPPSLIEVTDSITLLYLRLRLLIVHLPFGISYFSLLSLLVKKRNSRYRELPTYVLHISTLGRFWFQYLQSEKIFRLVHRGMRHFFSVIHKTSILNYECILLSYHQTQDISLSVWCSLRQSLEDLDWWTLLPFIECYPTLYNCDF